jgi:AraC family transcriptional regulator
VSYHTIDVHPDPRAHQGPDARPAAQSLTLGTTLEQLDAGAFTVTRSSYAPDLQLPRHAHDYASAIVVLRGGLTERVAGLRYECGSDRFLVRPAAEPHENSYGRRGAECVIVGAHPSWVECDAVARRVFSRPGIAAAPSVMLVARRMRRELSIGDSAAALAVEGLAMEFVAAAARQLRDRVRRVAPPWLREVRDALHDEPERATRLHVFAERARVHPAHLARAFRQFYGCSPGEYVRQRRIERGCTELAETNRSIAEIALDAGFASPSHFATAFRRITGTTPRDYRAAARDHAGRSKDPWRPGRKVQ